MSRAPRWRKLGKIFDPAEFRLPAGCVAFAQSPQALVCNEHVRIYFSTRSIDRNTGKYRSHIAYVDFDRNLRDVIGVCEHQVLPLGDLGCFDEHGIFPMNVLRVGSQIYGYTCGWSRRVSVSVETAIGLAISDDEGTTFARHGKGPILSATLQEPCLVGDGFVKLFDGLFHMWYIYGLPWKAYGEGSTPERIYKIAHATSSDGIRWRKTDGQQLIKDSIGEDECQALPTVIKIENQYHMYFCYRYATDFRSGPKRAYRIGYAYSDDLTHWIREDASAKICRSTSSTDWDSEMMCYPHVFDLRGQPYMLYNGNAFGRNGFGLAIAE